MNITETVTAVIAAFNNLAGAIKELAGSIKELSMMPHLEDIGATGKALPPVSQETGQALIPDKQEQGETTETAQEQPEEAKKHTKGGKGGKATKAEDKKEPEAKEIPIEDVRLVASHVVKKVKEVAVGGKTITGKEAFAQVLTDMKAKSLSEVSVEDRPTLLGKLEEIAGTTLEALKG